MNRGPLEEWQERDAFLSWQVAIEALRIQALTHWRRQISNRIAGRRPWALDLFCGAGGAAMGLHRAGFNVVGIDIRPQPRYPFYFIQADALAPPLDVSKFDLIWASPPCQKWSLGSQRWDVPRVDLIEATRLLISGHPCTIIENVERAPIRNDVLLDGPMFGLNTYRRRAFELSFPCLFPEPSRISGPRITPGFVTCAGHGGHGSNALAKWKDAMGIDWMRKGEIAEAVLPAYAEFIGRAAMTEISERRKCKTTW